MRRSTETPKLVILWITRKLSFASNQLPNDNYFTCVLKRKQLIERLVKFVKPRNFISSRYKVMMPDKGLACNTTNTCFYRPHPKDGGRYCFQFVSSHPGGTPSLSIPIPIRPCLGGGTRSRLGWGVVPQSSLGWGGYPDPALDGGVPRSSLGWGGYLNLGWGGTPTLDGVTPTLDGVTPTLEGVPHLWGSPPSHVWGVPPTHPE